MPIHYERTGIKETYRKSKFKEDAFVTKDCNDNDLYHCRECGHPYEWRRLSLHV